MSGQVVIAGALAQKPGWGGHAWALLQYALGFRELGWGVTFVDSLDALDADPSSSIRHFQDVMSFFDLASDSILFVTGSTGSEEVGLTRSEVLERLRNADFLLNIMGYLRDHELLAAAPRRVFLDIDPGFGQMWRELGLADVFSGHDVFVTIGENIGRPDCTTPTCGLDWITTPQPIALSSWPVSEPTGDAFTTIGAWRGPYDPIEFRGATYGLRVHEFRRFADLPAITGLPFEAALSIDEWDGADAERLRSGGWRLVDPASVAATPGSYRDYIAGSLAEIMIAKNMYVRSNSGWFSDRSICYLASGRPVVAQDTGWTRRLPSGEGLIAFSTPEEAAEGARRISADPVRHGRAARSVAEERFDARRVLPQLVERIESAR